MSSASGPRTKGLPEVEALDRAISAAIASTPTPTLDKALTFISKAATRHKLWLATAGALALVGERGKQAAVRGLAALGVSSLTADLVAKHVFPRLRPERVATNRGRDVR